MLYQQDDKTKKIFTPKIDHCISHWAAFRQTRRMLGDYIVLRVGFTRRKAMIAVNFWLFLLISAFRSIITR